MKRKIIYINDSDEELFTKIREKLVQLEKDKAKELTDSQIVRIALKVMLNDLSRKV